MCLKTIWKAIKAYFGRPGPPPPEPIETPPFPKFEARKGIVRAADVQTVRNWLDTQPRESVGKAIRDNQARKNNMAHRTKFSNAEHFKQRQPTTARKLWKPDAKLEED